MQVLAFCFGAALAGLPRFCSGQVPAVMRVHDAMFFASHLARLLRYLLVKLRCRKVPRMFVFPGSVDLKSDRGRSNLMLQTSQTARAFKFYVFKTGKAGNSCHRHGRSRSRQVPLSATQPQGLPCGSSAAQDWRQASWQSKHVSNASEDLRAIQAHQNIRAPAVYISSASAWGRLRQLSAICWQHVEIENFDSISVALSKMHFAGMLV